ncbi:hypothetical protein C8F01DRAFT_1256488 [Mycena amicta]|nr:hypothetical protein C8F01DRAFT_1256488 [Mycena amicta]
MTSPSVHQRLKIGFMMCGKIVDTEPDVVIMDGDNGDAFILLVQEDKRHLSLSRDSADAELIAEAVAAFSANNKQRIDSGLTPLTNQVVAGIIVLGTGPTFYKIPISSELVTAMGGAQYPPNVTVLLNRAARKAENMTAILHASSTTGLWKPAPLHGTAARLWTNIDATSHGLLRTTPPDPYDLFADVAARASLPVSPERAWFPNGVNEAQELGSGAYGIVYCAYDTNSPPGCPRYYVVKCMGRFSRYTDREIFLRGLCSTHSPASTLHRQFYVDGLLCILPTSLLAISGRSLTKASSRITLPQ